MTNLQSGIINNNFMEASFDEATGDMLELLSGLHQQMATGGRKLDWDAFASVPGPDIKPGIPRPPMDC